MTDNETATGGGPPPGPLANVAIFQTLIAALAATLRDPALLFRAAAGGLLLLAAANVIALFLPPGPFALMLSAVAPLIAYTHFGVNWYRVVLLGPEGVLRPSLRWDRRHWLFLGTGLALGGAQLMLGFVLAQLLPVSLALIILVLLYLGARVCFLFPAIAVAEPYSLAYAWRHSRGQGARLTVLLLLAGLPLMLAITMIVNLLFDALLGVSLVDLAAMLAHGGPPPGVTVSPLALLSLKMITEALFMTAMAVQFAIVALAFRTCTGWVPAGGGNLPATPDDDDDNDDPGSDARF